ncbi:CDP-alcohol phosphatidyltransferase family protein [Infirmifilum lucidum]|uniref:CDP-alcohol phosphatidyltransferase family protein n=1 Tax=Infirmifilum lucidum TaxID=2776706 RepID=A0A7L9FHC6_9CREN|nr:CDP-alcohol phosphatidyltransferase family protein [Infirmifilum lucidum]QOJ78403.1 CDP-alcohol phosphatidyltransferase family protein [Infirmifilum lucidum]
MLNKIKDRLQVVFSVLAKPIAYARIDSNLVTVSGLLFGVLALYFHKSYPTMLLLLLIMFLSDGIDGYIARSLNKVTPFGAFLDSTVDRVEDTISLYLLYLYGIASADELVASVTGAFLVSYTRSRAEALGVQMSGVGIAERAERLIITLLILLSYPFSIALSRALFMLLLVLIAITVIQRVLHVHRRLQGR